MDRDGRLWKYRDEDFQVTVSDTTAPVIRSLSATPNRITPRTTDGHGSPDCRCLGLGDAQPQTNVIGSRAISGLTALHRNSDQDMQIDGPMSVQVRAERNAYEGDRIYTITVESRDASGNASTRDVQVTVPRAAGH